MKVNRFQKNERKQELLIEEMEASISSFLTDIEDENSRLIESLKKSEVVTNKLEQENKEAVIEQEDSTIEQIVKESIVLHGQKEATGEAVKATLPERQTFNAPRAYVQNAYGSQTIPKIKKNIVQLVKEEPMLQTIEERVKDMYMRGMSADEIAKQLNRGKTEIVLMLKFHNKTL